MFNLLKASAIVVGVGMSVTACGGAIDPGGIGLSHQSLGPFAGLQLGSRTRTNARASHGGAWISPKAKSGELLYISDLGAGDVYIYSWPKPALVGTLTGVSYPAGECVDSEGNVWITNVFGSSVVEYAHGGTTPVATLSDTGQYPWSCAVSKSGDLAVANGSTTSGGPGSVTIYAGEGGSGTNYPDSGTNLTFVGYDGTRLYVSGSSYSIGGAVLQSFENGTFEAVTIQGGSLYTYGNIQRVGSLLAVGDETGPSGYGLIHQINKKDIIVGGTVLLGGGCSQFTIKGSKVICPTGANVLIYKYPAGGQATAPITGFSYVFGSAISR